MTSTVHEPDDNDPPRVPAPNPAEVVDLDEARAGRSQRDGTDLNARSEHDHQDDTDDRGEVDRESVGVVAPIVGPPVDPPDVSVPAGPLARAEFRRPIVPAWARSLADTRSAARWAVRYAGYVTAYHATRTPKYAARVVAWATVGLLRTPGGLARIKAEQLWEEDGGWLFAAPTGGPISPRTDYDEWKRLLTRAMVRDGRLHDARHTAATVLLLLGVPERAVMGLMGWSHSGMASKYQHITAQVRRDATRCNKIQDRNVPTCT